MTLFMLIIYNIFQWIVSGMNGVNGMIVQSPVEVVQSADPGMKSLMNAQGHHVLVLVRKPKTAMRHTVQVNKLPFY